MKTMRKSLIVILSFVFVLALAALGVACGNKVKLTFEGNNGESAQVLEVEKGSTQTPPSVSREGWSFEGWFQNADLTGEQLGESFTAPEENTTYYAKWEQMYLVILNAGTGGTLSATSLYLKPGELIAPALAGYAPTPASGLTFGGWFDGETELSSTRRMPTQDITLTARYKVGYTVEAWVSALDGSGYQKEDEFASTGSDFVGKELTLTAPSIAGLTAVANDGTHASLTLSATASENVFRFYYDRLSYSVIYVYDNLEDAEVTGSIEGSNSVPFGTTLTLADGALLSADGYRFAGWSLEPNGALTFEGNSTLKVDKNYILYAVWDKAKTDAFGGTDRLYVPSAEEGVVYLQRAGLEEKTGEYDPATRAFRFYDDNGEEMLAGRVTGDWFYYFFSDIINTYTTEDGVSSIEFKANGEASYRSTLTSPWIEGTYDIDAEGGYYTFDSNDGATHVAFNLTEGDSGILLVLQNVDEVGYYAVDFAYSPVIYLDGFGGLVYYYTDGYEYVDGDDNPIYELNGLYEASEENPGYFDALTYVGSNIVFEFSFRFVSGTADVPGYEIKGRIERDDGFYGTFPVMVSESSYYYLILDGFGNGYFIDPYTYGGEEGTYFISSDSFYFTLDGSSVNQARGIVVLMTDSGNYHFLIMETEDGAMAEILTASENNAVEGKYDFTELYLDGYSWNGFFYIGGVVESSEEDVESQFAMIWVEYGSLSDGSPVYAYYASGTLTAQDDGSYLFADGSDFKTGVSFADGVASIIGIHDYLDVDEERGLVLDLSTGAATYNGAPVEYINTSGIIDVYYFFVSDDELFLYWTKDGEIFGRIDNSDLYLLDTDLNDNYYTGALLYLGDDVYLGLRLTNGTYMFVAQGFVSPDTEGRADVYHFEIGDTVEDLNADYIAEYRDFFFKRVDGGDGFGLLVQEKEKLAFENLTSDGFDSFVYTDAEGTHNGIVYQLGLLYAFLPEGGSAEDMIVLVETDGNRVKPTASTTDAWYYYYVDEEFNINTNETIYLDGEGTATKEGKALIVSAQDKIEATYKRTANYREEENFMEFEIILDSGSFVIYAGYTQASTSSGTQTLPVYFVRDNTMYGEFDIVDDAGDTVGHLSGSGYTILGAVYTYEEDGETYEVQGMLYRVSVEDKSYVDAEFSILPDENGNGLIFTTGEASALFDLKEVSGKLCAWQRTTAFGMYARLVGDDLTGESIYLDGHGNAVLYAGEDEISHGTITEEENGLIHYESSDGRVTFSFSVFTDETNSMYQIYTEADNAFFSDPASWEVLYLDGFGNVLYFDKYGQAAQFSYEMISENLGIILTSSSQVLVSFDRANATFAYVDNSAYIGEFFAEDMSAVLFESAVLDISGVRSYYTVEGSTVTYYTYNAATRSYDEATMALPSGNTLTIGNTVYYRWNSDETITFTDSHLENADGETVTLTLSFAPDYTYYEGDYISLAALNDDSERYDFYLTYEAGKAVATLVFWEDGQSVRRNFALTMHFTGAAEGNTFVATPNGSKGTYTDGEGGQVTIDHLYVGHVDITNAVSVQFSYIEDSEGNELAGETDAEAVSAVSGGGYIISFTAADGERYSVWFDFEGDSLLLELVTRQAVCEAEDDYEFVIVVQQTYYVPGEEDAQTEIYSASVYINGGEAYGLEYCTPYEDPYFGQNADGSEFIIWSFEDVDWSTFQYVTQYLLIDLSKDGDGWVNGATVSTHSDIIVADEENVYAFEILYTYSSSHPFTVDKMYRFGVLYGDRILYDESATFSQEDSGAWAVTTDKGTLKVRITLTAQLALDVYVTQDFDQGSATSYSDYDVLAGNVEGEASYTVTVNGYSGTISGTIGYVTDSLGEALTFTNAPYVTVGHYDFGFLYQASTQGSDELTYVIRFYLTEYAGEEGSVTKAVRLYAVCVYQSFTATENMGAGIYQYWYSTDTITEEGRELKKYDLFDISVISSDMEVPAFLCDFADDNSLAIWIGYGYDESGNAVAVGNIFALSYDVTGLADGVEFVGSYYFGSVATEDGDFVFYVLVDSDYSVEYVIEVDVAGATEVSYEANDNGTYTVTADGETYLAVFYMEEDSYYGDYLAVAVIPVA